MSVTKHEKLCYKKDTGLQEMKNDEFIYLLQNDSMWQAVHHCLLLIFYWKLELIMAKNLINIVNESTRNNKGKEKNCI